jgi:hypothetical protein
VIPTDPIVLREQERQAYMAGDTRMAEALATILALSEQVLSCDPEDLDAAYQRGLEDGRAEGLYCV